MTDTHIVVALIIDALEQEADAHWRIGDELAKLPGTKEVHNMIASEVGRGGAWVLEHQRTAQAFTTEHRADDMSWKHHVACARTSDPNAWMDLCVEQQWSTRELRDALVAAGEITPRDKPEKKCPECGAIL